MRAVFAGVDIVILSDVVVRMKAGVVGLPVGGAVGQRKKDAGPTIPITLIAWIQSRLINHSCFS